MKKRIVSLMLVLVLVLTTALTGCGGKDNGEDTLGSNASTTKSTSKKDGGTESSETSNFNNEGWPIVNEPVTLTIAANSRESIKGDWNDLGVIQMVTEETNVNVDWDITPKSQWLERKNLIIASGDWPDVFFGNYIVEDKEIVKYASDGVFIPLEDLIEAYAPNIQKVFDEYPEFKAYCTAPDGHIYSVPVIHAFMSPAPSAQFINRAWLDEYGLEMPTTTDEFYEVLKVFKANLDEGETPFTFVFNHNTAGVYPGFGAFGLATNSHKLAMKDDEIYYAPMTEQYKEGISYIHKLFAEGLVDVESFSQKVPVYKSKVSNKTTGAFSWWSLSGLFGADYEASGYEFMPPLEGPNGEKGTFFKTTAALSGKGSFLITSTCENPEVAIRWADYIAQSEVSFQMSEGMIGRTFADEGGQLVAQPDPEGMNHDEFRHMDTPGAHSFHMVPASFVEDVVGSSALEEKRAYDRIYAEDLSSVAVPPFFLGTEDSQRVAEIRADLNQYVDEMSAKWMLEGGIEEEWDDYVAQLRAMGADELLEIYRNRYAEIK